MVLTACADGKMKPYVVFKGKGTRLIKQLQSIPDIVVTFSSNGWMNDMLTANLRQIIGQLSFSKRLLVWDAYKCHTSEATEAELHRLKVDTAVVPGGCTKFIQAADVAWNACFKAHLCSYYDLWLSQPSVHEYIRGGNLKHFSSFNRLVNFSYKLFSPFNCFLHALTSSNFDTTSWSI